MGQSIMQLDVDADLSGSWDAVLAKDNRQLDQVFEGGYVLYVQIDALNAVNGRVITGNDKSPQKKIDALWGHLVNHVEPFKTLNATKMLRKHR